MGFYTCLQISFLYLFSQHIGYLVIGVMIKAIEDNFMDASTMGGHSLDHFGLDHHAFWAGLSSGKKLGC